MEDKNYIYQRKSIRLRGYDYSKPGAYFITICINRQQNRLGDIKDGKSSLNDVGEMVENWLKKLPNIRNKNSWGWYVHHSLRSISEQEYDFIKAEMVKSGLYKEVSP